MYLFQYFAGLESTFGKNTVYTSKIHEMSTFIENYLHFMKNCIRPHYEKLKPLKSGFIENSKGWLGIAKLKPLVERYSCQPMRRLDTSNNLSVGPSCM